MSKSFIGCFIGCIIVLIFLIISCNKDYSYEGGVKSFVAKGSLQDSVGNCQDIVVSGAYLPDSALKADNYITVKANITKAGKYLIFTDTVNGCWFLDSGILLNTGAQSFKLKGYGKTITPIFGSFSVHFDSSVCTFMIPTNAAVYTFNAAVGSCPNINVNGIYRVGATLNATDTVSVPITVLVPGAFSIQTATVNGMSFSAKGIFLKPGNYNISLKGDGLPLKKGASQIPIVVSNTTCNFLVNVITDPSMYWKFTAEGYNYFGLLDSLYGALPDTGFFITNNPNRIFATTIGGGDSNNNMDSSNFNIVISRLNTPLIMGSYHAYDILGGADFNAYMSFLINNKLWTNNYFIYSSARLNQFTVNLTSYDPVSKLVQGNFSGAVYKLKSINDGSGPVIKITNGEFKTYMAH